METRSGKEVFALRGKEYLWFFKNCIPEDNTKIIAVEILQDESIKITVYSAQAFSNLYAWNKNLCQIKNILLDEVIIQAVIDTAITFSRLSDIRPAMAELIRGLGKPV